MADGKTPGPLCRTRKPLKIHDGTLCLQVSPIPVAVGLNSDSSLTAISRMSSGEKLGAAILRARRYVGPEIGDKLLALVTPESLAIIGSAAVLWVGGHFIGASWLVDGVLIGLGAYALGHEAFVAGRELMSFVQLGLAAQTPEDLDKAGQHFARFVVIVGVDTAIALLLRKTAGAKGKASTGKPQINHDFVMPSAGRGGPKLKHLIGPPNSVVKSIGPGRIFITNEKGQVIFDITAKRVKPVIPGVGEGEKRLTLTPEELELLRQLWGR